MPAPGRGPEDGPKRKPRVDLTRKTGNPARALQDKYAELMAIEDPDQLARFAIDTVKPLVGSGMSEKNYANFLKTLSDASRNKGIDGIKSYLTHYILIASGLGVIEGDISAMAGMISEDIDERRTFTHEQLALKKLVEKHTGFRVTFDDRGGTIERP